MADKIITPQGIDMQGQNPVELKTVKQTIADRDDITAATRYRGLEVYVVDEDKKYMLRSDIVDWKEIIELRDAGNGNAYFPGWFAVGKTTAPQATLDVSGNSIIDGNQEIVGNLVVGVDAHVKGNLLVDNDVTANNLFTKSDFISSSTGVPDAGKPVVLNANGVLDSSLISIDSIHYVAPFTPSLAQEYPDISNETAGAFWIVSGLTTIQAEYTFSTGPLIGQSASNGDYMVFNGGNDWSIVDAGISVDEFYFIDGTNPITAPFAGGGQQFKNAADGTDATDLVTLQQLNTHTAADSNRLGGELPSYYQDASNINAGTLDNARLNTTIDSDTTGNAATASRLETARTISLVGDVTATGVPFDGSGNIVLTTTIANGGKWSDMDSGQGITYVDQNKGIGIDVSTTRTLWEEQGPAHITMIADENIRNYSITWVADTWTSGMSDWVAIGVTDGALKIEANDEVAFISQNILELYNQGTLKFTVDKGGKIHTASTGVVTNLNADYLDNYHADSSATANTVAVRDSNADLYANDFILSSDKRLKNEIELLDKGIDGLIPRKFKFIGDDRIHYGFIAQEMLETHPELVLGGGETSEGNPIYYSVSEISIIALLVKEVQELKKKLEDK